MKFEPGKVDGGYIVSLEERADERGFFARAFCVDEFAAQGLDTDFVQCNMSGNVSKGTIRGMHWQTAPHQETKFIRCIKGAIYDVIVDIRPDSPTYLQWMGAELTAENRLAMYAPKGTAHGYLTLTDDAEVFYMVTTRFNAEADSGARWDDPAFGIEWPSEPTIISPKDENHPPFQA
jgi:dTDP-4-dehydrorhamnose 3,5-epimerase